MDLTIIGCSDAFGSGGRYHSCYLLDTSAGRLMIDCGANAPLALKRAGIPLTSVDAILISHCHGDHFGGLPFLFLDKLFIAKCTRTMEIFGPRGVDKRTKEIFDACYPGVREKHPGIGLAYNELKPEVALSWRGLTIDTYEVDHFSNSPSLAIAVTDQGRRFAFSGDSTWCEGIFAAGRKTDLYLIECTNFSTKSGVHLDYVTLATKFEEIGAKKYLLTHMGDEMLNASGAVDMTRCMLAKDGLVVKI